jgi:hypothetical protein
MAAIRLDYRLILEGELEIVSVSVSGSISDGPRLFDHIFGAGRTDELN